MRKLLAVLLAAIMAAQAVLAIGVSPAKFNIDVEAGMPYDIALRVLNNDLMEIEVEMLAQGELAEFVEFESKSFTMMPDEGERKVKAEISLPENFTKDEQKLAADIIVMAKPAGQESMINVVGAVIAKVYANVMPHNFTVQAPEFNDSRSTEGIPTPKGGEELSNEGGFVVEKSPRSSSSPFSHLFLMALILLAAAMILRHWMASKK